MTVADTIYDTINDNWGNGGYGGTTPAITTSETAKQPDGVTADVIEVRHFAGTGYDDQKNDVYANKYDTVVVRITSKTSAAQLQLLYDEVEYLVRNTTMTGIQFHRLWRRYDPTSRERGVHGVDMYVEVVALLASGAVTSASTTGYNWHEAMMITSTYAAWVPLSFADTNVDGAAVWTPTSSQDALINTSGTDFNSFWILTQPTNRGNLKLYVSGVQVDISDADATNYVSSTYVKGVDFDTATDVNSDFTDYTSAQQAQATFTAVDMSGYMAVMVELACVVANASALDIRAVSLRCYYDT